MKIEINTRRKEKRKKEIKQKSEDTFFLSQSTELVAEKMQKIYSGLVKNRRKNQG